MSGEIKNQIGKVNAGLDYLLELQAMDKFNEIFSFALKETAKEYQKHCENKGDSWKEMSTYRLRGLLEHEYQEYLATVADTPAEYAELIDILNVGFMLLTRLSEERKELS